MNNNKLNDKRVKKYLVFDTETAPHYQENGSMKHIVFDIGYTVCDRHGNILIERTFLVKEIFLNMSMMKHAYYFNKYPSYLEKLNNNSITLMPWIDIIHIMEKDIECYNIKNVYAYNMNFDLTAINNTQMFILDREFLFFKAVGVRPNCLWGMACESFLSTKKFMKLAIEQEWLTQGGNITTNAETAYRYIANAYDFEESHTALEDSRIETIILSKCLKSRQKLKGGIYSQPWRMVKSKALSYGLLGDSK